MKYYLLDFYDLGCTMKPVEEKGKNTFTGIVSFPDGHTSEFLLKQHEFCVATIEKCLSGEKNYEKFLEENVAFLSAQRKARNKLDIWFFLIRCLLMMSFILITFACVATYFPLIVLAIFLVMVYKYYIYPKMAVIFSDRHVALIKYKTKQSN